MNFRSRLQQHIPGGAHTYSKGADQFPSNAPELLARGKGAYVFDPQGKKYLDYGMGLRSVGLGYANPYVDRAAIRGLRAGNNLTLPSRIELAAAEEIIALMPALEMVKFSKNGSSAVTAAVKIARAWTGKFKVAICEDHPFFSYDDWFIVSTAMQRGIHPDLENQILKFSYNDIGSLKKILDENRGEVAAILLEPATSTCPHGLPKCPCFTGEGAMQSNFLQQIRQLANEHNAVFILDEMITGFRFNLVGAHTYFDVKPDLLTFGKAMANGYSVACVGGKRELLELGSILPENTERVFLMSSTHGAEMSSLNAFRGTLEIYKATNPTDHFWKYGNQLKDEFNKMAAFHGVNDFISIEGFGCSPYLKILDSSGNHSFPLRTLFNQEMIRNQVLMPWIAISTAHGERELGRTLEAASPALQIYAKALDKGWEQFLIGSPQKPVFRKYN